MKWVCVAVVGVMVFGVFASVGSATEVKPDIKAQPVVEKRGPYTPHAPIRINNDTDFTNQFFNRKITGFLIDSSSGPGIYIANCVVPFTISDCQLINAHNDFDQEIENIGSGLTLRNCSNGTIMNNNCSHNIDDHSVGILLYISTNNTIYNNTCDENHYGIHMSNSRFNMAINNSCDNNVRGLLLNMSSSNLIKGNQFENCVVGIHIDGSNDNRIDNNKVSSDWWCGCSLYNSSSNEISNNTFIYNYDCNLATSDTQLNRITQNTFINSLTFKQIFYYSANNNIWNTSTKGNYWSNWTSPDNDSNGIVDIPYSINATNGEKDYFPLVHENNPIKIERSLILTVDMPTYASSGLNIIISAHVEDNVTNFAVAGLAMSFNVSSPYLGQNQTIITDENGYANASYTIKDTNGGHVLNVNCTIIIKGSRIGYIECSNTSVISLYIKVAVPDMSPMPPLIMTIILAVSIVSRRRKL